MDREQALSAGAGAERHFLRERMQREQSTRGHRQGRLLPQRRRLPHAGQEGTEAARPALFQGDPEIGAAMRRRIAALLAAALLMSWLPATAQTYPAHPVRMLIAFSAGGTIDALGRILAQKLSERWGQSVLVENRGGAAGNLGALAAAQAVPDGYTIHLGAQSLATAQDVLMVPPGSPAHSLDEWIAYARAHPGELNYASLGTGSSGHLATLRFMQVLNLKLEHVPYSSVSQALSDIVAGRVAIWLATLGGHLGNIQGGRVRALAVSGPTRAPSLPDVPTFVEQGVPLTEESTWFGIFVPRGTPGAITAKLNYDVAEILAEAAFHDRAVALGFRLVGGPPEKLSALLQGDIAKWATVAATAGLVAH